MPILIKNSQRSISINLKRTEKDLNRALRLLGLQQSELSVVFVGDAAMRRLNRQYRGLDKTTDVLSFPLCESGLPAAGEPLGDIVISVPRAAAQAASYDVSFREELLRLLLHGLLHLLGYDHEKNAYQKQRMQRKEKELIHALAPMD
ncbi:MAG: rRNA maturation RNase YbeY [Thermodesulfovibrio sp.]|nr:rRNA maturation RNase YbeY [Thermodesulfovibrio sp.]